MCLNRERDSSVANERPSEVEGYLNIAGAMHLKDSLNKALGRNIVSSATASMVDPAIPLQQIKDISTIRVNPKPGFVIKTKRTTNQSKVFVNITTDSNVRYKPGRLQLK